MWSAGCWRLRFERRLQMELERNRSVWSVVQIRSLQSSGQLRSKVGCCNRKGRDGVHFQTVSPRRHNCVALVWKKRKLKIEVQTSLTISRPHTWPIATWTGHRLTDYRFQRFAKNVGCSPSWFPCRKDVDGGGGFRHCLTIQQALQLKHTDDITMNSCSLGTCLTTPTLPRL